MVASMNYSIDVVNWKGRGALGARSSSALAALDETAAGGQMTGKDGEHGRDPSRAKLARADDSTSG